MNVAILIGRLTRDPELKYVPSTGKAVANFTIAVDRPYTSKSGERMTDFFNIVVWGKQAENCANYIAKGRLVGIKGTIENRSYENQNGEKKYVTEIVAENVQFLEFATKGNQVNGANVMTEEEIDYDDSGYRELEDEEAPF